ILHPPNFGCLRLKGSFSTPTDGMRRPVSGRDAVRSQVIDVLKAQIKRRPAMKKVSSSAEQEYFAAETDHWIGSGRSQQLVLRAGRIRPDTTGAARAHECESVARSLRRDAAQPDRAGNRDAFALDQSLAQRVRA